MPSATADFSVRWESLSDVEREFLLAAYDIDQRLPQQRMIRHEESRDGQSER